MQKSSLRYSASALQQKLVREKNSATQGVAPLLLFLQIGSRLPLMSFHQFVHTLQILSAQVAANVFCKIQASPLNEIKTTSYPAIKQFLSIATTQTRIRFRWTIPFHKEHSFMFFAFSFGGFVRFLFKIVRISEIQTCKNEQAIVNLQCKFQFNLLYVQTT